MKTLICMIGQLRAADVTWTSFKRYVLDELNADLAVSGEGQEYDESNPYWRHAAIRLVTQRPNDLAAAFDAVQRSLQCGTASPPDWRQILAVPGNWLGGLGSSELHPGAGAVLLYKKWAFLRQLLAGKAIEGYDRFVITRSDFLWLAPHPPLDLLAASAIWVPAGEDYGGLNDRHAVVSMPTLPPYLDGLTPILRDPATAVRAGMRNGGWNVERYLRRQLRQYGVLKNVRRMPYIMALVRGEKDPTGWSPGVWHDGLGVYVKTPPELMAAEFNASYFRSTEQWRRHIGNYPTDDHVLRRAMLVPVSRRSKCDMRRSLLGRHSPRDLTSVVGVGGEALYYLHGGGDTLTEFQKRTAWHFSTLSSVERATHCSAKVSYVRCGRGVLSVDWKHGCRFRLLPAMKTRFPVFAKTISKVLRKLRATYFRLEILDSM